jgi:purine-binding chemotaxis protein CheW
MGFVKRIQKMPKHTNNGWLSERMDEIPETVANRVYYKDDLYEREVPKEKSLQFIVFRLDREWYGVEITEVKRIIKVGKITYLPSSPEHIAGIVNLRGNILSVTDLKTVFSLPHEEATERTRIIAIESGILETGLLVDEVVDSIEVPVSKIEPALFTLPDEGGKYIKGQFKVDNKLIGLISVEKILEKRDNLIGTADDVVQQIQNGHR